MLEQLKYGFKRATNWNKYQSEVSTERKKQYLDFLIQPNFQRVNRLFVLIKIGNKLLNLLGKAFRNFFHYQC